MENEQKNQPSPKKRPLNAYVRYSGLGIQMIVTMLFAAWGGMKLDAHFQNKKPWFTIFLLLFGVISSIYFVIRGLMNGNE